MIDLSDEEFALIKAFRHKKSFDVQIEKEFVEYLTNLEKGMDPILFEMYDIKELYYEFLNKKNLEKLSKFEDETWEQYGKEECKDIDSNGW